MASIEASSSKESGPLQESLARRDHHWRRNQRKGLHRCHVKHRISAGIILLPFCLKEDLSIQQYNFNQITHWCRFLPSFSIISLVHSQHRSSHNPRPTGRRSPRPSPRTPRSRGAPRRSSTRGPCRCRTSSPEDVEVTTWAPKKKEKHTG